MRVANSFRHTTKRKEKPIMRFVTAIPTTFALVVLMLAAPLREASADDTNIGPDRSWVTLTGTIVSAGPHAFRLDYGPDIITVEMDDFDSFPEGSYLLQNDRVTVTGQVDDDLFHKKRIEASSVYLPSIATHFWANSADEEDSVIWAAPPLDPGEFHMTGYVTSVDGREFTMDTGLRSITVDTSSMVYNPMDKRGYQRIDVGDRVRVTGEMDYDLFEGRQIMANYITTLAE